MKPIPGNQYDGLLRCWLCNKICRCTLRKRPPPMRRTNLNIRLADQNPACRGRPHERNTQFPANTIETVKHQTNYRFQRPWQKPKTETRRFCYQLWAEATGTEPPKKNNTNPANRDREAPHGTSPPTPPGIRITYHGGSVD